MLSPMTCDRLDPSMAYGARTCRLPDGSLVWEVRLKAGARNVGMLVHKGQQEAARECGCQGGGRGGRGMVHGRRGPHI